MTQSPELHARQRREAQFLAELGQAGGQDVYRATMEQSVPREGMLVAGELAVGEGTGWMTLYTFKGGNMMLSRPAALPAAPGSVEPDAYRVLASVNGGGARSTVVVQRTDVPPMGYDYNKHGTATRLLVPPATQLFRTGMTRSVYSTSFTVGRPDGRQNLYFARLVTTPAQFYDTVRAVSAGMGLEGDAGASFAFTAVDMAAEQDRAVELPYRVAAVLGSAATS